MTSFAVNVILFLAAGVSKHPQYFTCMFFCRGAKFISFDLLHIAMFHCPVCMRMILVRNGSDIVKHLNSHRNFGDPFSWPLGCLLCQGSNFKNVKTFKQHYETCHSEVFEVSVAQGCCGVERQDAQNVPVDNVDERADCISDNILALKNRAGYEAIIRSGLFTFMSNSSIPHTSIERIIRFCSDYVSMIVNNVINVFTKFREAEISDRTDQNNVTVLEESVDVCSK